jgi:hypothetical protein
MRRFFFVLGIVFCVLIVAVGGLVGFVAHRGYGLDAESKVYVDQAVVDIGKNWDQTELLRRASPDLLRKASPAQIAALFQQLARFGHLVHYDGAKGQANMSLMFGSGARTSAHYEATAMFENGPLALRIDLSKKDERWMIDGFHVDLVPPGAPLVTKPL